MLLTPAILTSLYPLLNIVVSTYGVHSSRNTQRADGQINWRGVREKHKEGKNYPYSLSVTGTP